MTSHKIVTREQWAAAREELLAREKEHTRLGDELARQRRELPWARVEKEYRFDTDDGTRTLAALFDVRGQSRGVEFLMGYYPILDRAPNGRDEGDGFQLWIRRHDEYHNQ
jgi:predicted dithiol-disulfide oxidoreductase (DUF899 family)